MKNSNTDSVPSIVDLRRLGYKVRVSHFRNVLNFTGRPFVERVTKLSKAAGNYKDFPILEHGGRTEIELTNREGVTFHALAECSNKDQFNRRLGNHICLARLAKQGAF